MDPFLNRIVRREVEHVGLPQEKPLTLEEITSIVDLLTADPNKRLADRRVTVKLDPKAKEWVAEKGYDPVFGARPLKHFLQRNVETNWPGH